MDKKYSSIDIMDSSRIIDSQIWSIYYGKKHKLMKENDPELLKFEEILYKKITKFSNNSNNNSVGYCKGCGSFITLQGARRIKLNHPQQHLITMKRLFQEENITNVESFIAWYNRTSILVKYKGRECQKSIVPTINSYHKTTEYDTIPTKQEKRIYVMNLEEKVRKLEAENQMLKKRLLVSHVIEFASPDFIATKKLS